MFGGTVVDGEKKGKGYGFPTANLDIAPSKTHLAEGVFAGIAWLNGTEYGAAISVRHEVGVVEVYLLDYTGGDFYGSRVEVEALQQISQMEQFEWETDLIAKIARDVEATREIVKQYYEQRDREENI